MTIRKRHLLAGAAVFALVVGAANIASAGSVGRAARAAIGVALGPVGTFVDTFFDSETANPGEAERIEARAIIRKEQAEKSPLPTDPNTGQATNIIASEADTATDAALDHMANGRNQHGGAIDRGGGFTDSHGVGHDAGKTSAEGGPRTDNVS